MTRADGSSAHNSITASHGTLRHLRSLKTWEASASNLSPFMFSYFSF